MHEWICFLNFLQQRPGRSARGLKVHVADKPAEQLPIWTGPVSVGKSCSITSAPALADLCLARQRSAYSKGQRQAQQLEQGRVQLSRAQCPAEVTKLGWREWRTVGRKGRRSLACLPWHAGSGWTHSLMRWRRSITLSYVHCQMASCQGWSSP